MEGLRRQRTGDRVKRNDGGAGGTPALSQATAGRPVGMSLASGRIQHAAGNCTNQREASAAK